MTQRRQSDGVKLVVGVMRSRTWQFWPLGASLLLHAVAVLSWSGAVRSARGPAPAAPDAWLGRSVSVETLEEGARSSEPDTAPATHTPPPPTLPPAAPDPLTARGGEPAPASRSQGAVQRRAPSQPRSMAPRESGEEQKPVAVREPTVPREPSGEFGAEGLPSGVRRLAIAFIRAVPAATSRDPIWSSLPVGDAGSVRVEVRVNEVGHIVHTETLGPTPAAEHLARLLQRTVLLLQSGRFAVSGVSAGDLEVFRIDVQVSMREPAEGFETGQVVRLGFEPPDARGRGKAFFTLGSGRHVEAAIRVERTRG
ncbi:MAG TPA: hypothetical protein VI072_24820 [Polyangiaceae bacterium]